MDSNPKKRIWTHHYLEVVRLVLVIVNPRPEPGRRQPKVAKPFIYILQERHRL